MTPKQQRFVREYLVDLNATQAAIRAGFSAKTAYSQGQRLLKHVEVAAAIALAQTERAKRIEITADRVVQELGRIAFADVRRIFTQGGGVLLPVDLDDDTAACVQSVEVVERPVRNADGEIEIEHVRKIRLHDKLGALVNLGKHLGIFGDSQGPVVNVNVAIIDRPPQETRAEWLERKARERQALLGGPEDERAA